MFTVANRTPLELASTMRAGIAQHGAPFREHRNRGFKIVNEMVYMAGGIVRSRYWLRQDRQLDGGCE
jgi:hypothetical protein